jgi:uncharacterized membrane protein YgaE (UPF0421/DUF939 family)
MIKWIKSLFTGCSRKIEMLKKENTQLKNEVFVLSEKVLERQEQINKTNAYYKKKLHDLKKSKSKKNDL